MGNEEIKINDPVEKLEDDAKEKINVEKNFLLKDIKYKKL